MRVTQIQQTLPVDIIFVYFMPKLLGLLTLLAFVQVYDLKDNSGIDSVGAGLKKFLSVAKGRGFDTKCIRTDGEGAVTSLTVDLEKDHGLTVEPTGSDTHVVEEIERICQTLKKRIRCHFHDLQKLRINMVVSRLSMDKVSHW